MSTLPDKDLEQIVFMEQHAPIWAAAPTTVGLTSQTCTAITTAVSNARKAFDGAQLARQASKAATTGQKNNLHVMHTLAADAIKTIRLYAETTNNPAVYEHAQIDPPSPPTPALPPTQAVQIRASIEPNGALTLAWKAAPAPTSPVNGQMFDASTQGVIYIISRKINNEATFSQVGTADPSRAGARGTSTFTDNSLIAGSTNIQYLIIPRRGALIGPMSDVFSVTLGVGSGGGGMFIAATSSAPMKIAA
jgi:hypothetical protein